MNNRQLTIGDQDLQLVVQHYEHGERIEEHSHDFYEIVFVDQGFSMHRVYNDISLLLSGDIFFIPPGVNHQYWRTKNNNVYNCLFYPQILGEDINELNKLPMMDFLLKDSVDAKWSKIHLKPDDRYDILVLLKKIIKENKLKQLGWKVRSKALFIDFLVSLSRAWASKGTNSDNSYSGNSIMPYKMLKALELSVTSSVTVEEMAKASGYSSEYFSRIFKQLSGMTPSAYIISMKISASAQLLRDPNLSISKVAELQGFDDVNYFSRLFKKETGKTPTEFKKLI